MKILALTKCTGGDSYVKIAKELKFRRSSVQYIVKSNGILKKKTGPKPMMKEKLKYDQLITKRVIKRRTEGNSK